MPRSVLTGGWDGGGGGGAGTIGGGGGEGAEGTSKSGDRKVVVSREVQPAFLKVGARGRLVEGIGAEGVGTLGAVGECSGCTTSSEVDGVVVVQPDFLTAVWVATVLSGVSSEEDETDVQPDFLNPGVSACVVDAITGSTVVLDEAVDEDVTTDLAILTPAAAAIFLNSFSSRFLSFSLRLSTSSFGMRRCDACMSLNRALW